MTDRFRLTIGQLNATVGDLDGNAARARDAWEQARDAGADMLALPEMFITGYQTQDLVLKPAFTAQAEDAIMALGTSLTARPGHRHRRAVGATDGRTVANAWWVFRDGALVARVLKHHLPYKQLFDELRLFDSGPISGPYPVGAARIGSPIDAEDSWYRTWPRRWPRRGPRSWSCRTAAPITARSWTCAWATWSAAWSRRACPWFM